MNRKIKREILERLRLLIAINCLYSSYDMRVVEQPSKRYAVLIGDEVGAFIPCRYPNAKAIKSIYDITGHWQMLPGTEFARQYEQRQASDATMEAERRQSEDIYRSKMDVMNAEWKQQLRQLQRVAYKAGLLEHQSCVFVPEGQDE